MYNHLHTDKPRRHYPPTERRKMAHAMKREGKTYREIGEKLGVSHQRAQQLVRPPKAIYDAVKDRARGRCEDCGIADESGHVHHADEFAELHLNDAANLEYLCASCHRTRHLSSGVLVPREVARRYQPVRGGITVSMRFPKRLHAVLVKIATEKQCSMNNLVILLLEQAVAKPVKGKR